MTSKTNNSDEYLPIEAKETGKRIRKLSDIVKMIRARQEKVCGRRDLRGKSRNQNIGRKLT
jgi:hypothetical protein